MSDSAKPSASVIASAIVAILAGLLFLLFSAIGFMAILLRSNASNMELPSFARNSALAGIAFMMVTSIFAIAVGIGLFLLRNWARISVLVLAGFSVFFGAIGVIVFTVTAVLPQQENLPQQQMWIFRTVLAAIYGVPLAIGTWWLILFNRKAIKLQFTDAAVPVDPKFPRKPRCPTPIAVLAWLFIACVLDIPFMAFMPNIPLLLFGHVIGGQAGRMCFILMFLLFTVAGIGLLKLKPWSYYLTLGMQFFFLTSGIVTLLNPNFKTVSRSLILEMENSMPMPNSGFSLLDYPHYMDWAMGFGLLFALAILVMLVYYRTRFLELAAVAALPRR
jgi:hypothetical protein